MLKRGGTKLSIISTNRLFLICSCGHSQSVLVSDLIERVGSAATVGDVVSRLRCSKCGVRGVKEYRITSPAMTDNPMHSASQETMRRFDG